TGINNFGVTSGWYLGTEHSSGFVRSADGTFTPFDVGTYTQMGGINDAGNLCGEANGDEAWVSIDGTVTTFTIPNGRNPFASGINKLNQCVGNFSTRTGYHGFLRNADGTLIYPINATNAASTLLTGINDRGEMVGYDPDPNGTGNHAVFFLSNHTNASFD